MFMEVLFILWCSSRHLRTSLPTIKDMDANSCVAQMNRWKCEIMHTHVYCAMLLQVLYFSALSTYKREREINSISESPPIAENLINELLHIFNYGLQNATKLLRGWINRWKCEKINAHTSVLCNVIEGDLLQECVFRDRAYHAYEKAEYK